MLLCMSVLKPSLRRRTSETVKQFLLQWSRSMKPSISKCHFGHPYIFFTYSIYDRLQVYILPGNKNNYSSWQVKMINTVSAKVWQKTKFIRLQKNNTTFTPLEPILERLKTRKCKCSIIFLQAYNFCLLPDPSRWRCLSSYLTEVTWCGLVPFKCYYKSRAFTARLSSDHSRREETDTRSLIQNDHR